MESTTSYGDPTPVLESKSSLTTWKTNRPLRTQIEQIECWVLAEIRQQPALAALRSALGIGVLLGSTILLESASIERFAAVGDYASYCRRVNLCSAVHCRGGSASWTMPAGPN